MAITGITDAMHQYGKTTESIYKNKPKYPKAHGVKRPETTNIIAGLTIIFLLLVIISML
ncbi:MAG: hypothetical protein A4E48_00204 [Methanosaeta sp. PtaU1.Bin060]|jgi:apolipoprotein N-acyltransferase|nr:MAG: hypothetical protein A4E48_00204 [Methanosaeta sp. PtaU1.Bin060]